MCMTEVSPNSVENNVKSWNSKTFLKEDYGWLPHSF